MSIWDALVLYVFQVLIPFCSDADLFLVGIKVLIRNSSVLEQSPGYLSVLFLILPHHCAPDLCAVYTFVGLQSLHLGESHSL